MGAPLSTASSAFAVSGFADLAHSDYGEMKSQGYPTLCSPDD